MKKENMWKCDKRKLTDKCVLCQVNQAQKLCSVCTEQTNDDVRLLW